jgi:hypothetical protein
MAIESARVPRYTRKVRLDDWTFNSVTEDMFATLRAGLRREVLADIADTIDKELRDREEGPAAYLMRRGRRMALHLELPLNAAGFTIECDLGKALAFEASFEDDDALEGHAAWLRREAAKIDLELKRRKAAREEHAARKAANV